MVVFSNYNRAAKRPTSANQSNDLVNFFRWVDLQLGRFDGFDFVGGDLVDPAAELVVHGTRARHVTFVQV